MFYKNKSNFLESEYKGLLFFSEIKIMFLLLFFNIFNDIKLEIVSTVFPDFEITKKKYFF